MLDSMKSLLEINKDSKSKLSQLNEDLSSSGMLINVRSLGVIFLNYKLYRIVFCSLSDEERLP